MSRNGALLERESELAAIGAAVDAAVAGAGVALAVEGEAGLGKTRLLAEARGLAAEAGVEVLAGRAGELERDFPFAMPRQLLGPRLRTASERERESLFDGAGAARGILGFGADEDRSPDTFAVLHALYWVVAGMAERGPLLLAVDDAHLADPASLHWLAFMLPRLQDLPVVLALARRTDEAESPGLARVLGDPGVETVVPKPLSTTATTTLIERSLRRQPDPTFAVACHEVTGGNPFLVTELLRELAEQGVEPTAELSESVRGLAPQRVAQMVLARIARLPPEAAELARSVAVLGDGVEPPLAVELAGLDPEVGRRTADALRRAAILDPGESLRFMHPLVRNAVYSDLAAGERGDAHAAAAALLRFRGAHPEQAATQLLAGEPRGDRAAVETLLEVGRRSLADGAPRAAVTHLARALREPPPGDLRIEVLELLLAAGIRAADHEALAAAEPELRAVLEREPSSSLRLVIPLTTAMALGARFEDAAAVLQDAIRTVVAEGNVESAFTFEAQLRTLATIVPGLPEVDLQQYVNEVEPDSPAGRLAAAIEARAAVVDGASAQVAANAAERALGANCAIFEDESEFSSAMSAVLILITADKIDTAKKAAHRALEIARGRDATPDLSRGLLLCGFAAWASGDLLAAESYMHEARELARLAEILALQLICAGPLTDVLIERDELDAAAAILEEAGIASGPVPENALFQLLLLARGHLRYELGEFALAAEDFTTLGRQGESLGFGPGPMLTVGPFAIGALVATGRREDALEMAEICDYHARRWGPAASLSHMLRGSAKAQGGAEEIELLEESLTVLGNSPRQLQRLHALVDLGAALRRQNRRAEARAPLREALKLARRCGAVRAARRAREELQATGETVRRYAPIGVESLTPSERRVAEMAATGMTNRQIAQSLFVTLKTVEAHLSAAYDKLDIESRHQLGDALSEATEGS